MKGYLDTDEFGMVVPETGPEELESMSEYWEEDHYVDIPDELIKRYNDLHDELWELDMKFRALADAQGKKVME